ncbi:transcription factor MYBS2-like [Arachis stenosperma]|uniref:transcription factor MYBS2-like n=1 Tax=Arachis stenosperma TaxID=217475 RepID=UPI0025AC47DC|nr:transcription factor MYBS2-like [Arachis stenosperma]
MVERDLQQLYMEEKEVIHWNPEEREQFLKGVEKYGKGKYKRISREFVPSKTPKQVASHAQKYFLKQQEQSEENTNKRRCNNIHDMNNASNVGETEPNKLEKTLTIREPQVQHGIIDQHNDVEPIISLESANNNQFEVIPNSGNLHSDDPYECDQCFREALESLVAQGVTFDGNSWCIPPHTIIPRILL